MPSASGMSESAAHPPSCADDPSVLPSTSPCASQLCLPVPRCRPCAPDVILFVFLKVWCNLNVFFIFVSVSYVFLCENVNITDLF